MIFRGSIQGFRFRFRPAAAVYGGCRISARQLGIRLPNAEPDQRRGSVSRSEPTSDRVARRSGLSPESRSLGMPFSSNLSSWFVITRFPSQGQVLSRLSCRESCRETRPACFRRPGALGRSNTYTRERTRSSVVRIARSSRTRARIAQAKHF